jgi:ABC-type transport system involved in multi-copper enzyme maturation permease subunit
MSKTTFLAPLLIVMLIVMVVILRLTGRLPHSSLGDYAQIMLTLVLVGLVGLALALLTSAFVSTSQQATDMLSVWIMPQVLFGGALVAVHNMNVVGKVISVVAPVRWSFEALGHIVNLHHIFDTDPNSRVGVGLGIVYTNTFDHSPAPNWVILALFIVVPIALTCWVLKRKTSKA